VHGLLIVFYFTSAFYEALLMAFPSVLVDLTGECNQHAHRQPALLLGTISCVMEECLSCGRCTGPCEPIRAVWWPFRCCLCWCNARCRAQTYLKSFYI